MESCCRLTQVGEKVRFCPGPDPSPGLPPPALSDLCPSLSDLCLQKEDSSVFYHSMEVAGGTQMLRRANGATQLQRKARGSF